MRTFVDRDASTERDGLIAELPDLDALDEMRKTAEAAEAIKDDGVRPDSIGMLVES